MTKMLGLAMSVVFSCTFSCTGGSIATPEFTAPLVAAPAKVSGYRIVVADDSPLVASAGDAIRLLIVQDLGVADIYAFLKTQNE